MISIRPTMSCDVIICITTTEDFGDFRNWELNAYEWIEHLLGFEGDCIHFLVPIYV